MSLEVWGDDDDGHEGCMNAEEAEAKIDLLRSMLERWTHNIHFGSANQVNLREETLLLLERTK